jgi:hypothetical protein
MVASRRKADIDGRNDFAATKDLGMGCLCLMSAVRCGMEMMTLYEVLCTEYHERAELAPHYGVLATRSDAKQGLLSIDLTACVDPDLPFAVRTEY